jgi:hypothetical protein
MHVSQSRLLFFFFAACSLALHTGLVQCVHRFLLLLKQSEHLRPVLHAGWIHVALTSVWQRIQPGMYTMRLNFSAMPLVRAQGKGEAA